MKKYCYPEEELKMIENNVIPMAVYQFINKRVVTIALSQGFLDIFDFDDRKEAYFLMDNDMYRDTYPDDVARIADAAYRFATEGGEYNVFYRSKIKDKYIIINAHGKHVYKEDGVRLAIIWYTYEGDYVENGAKNLFDFDGSINEVIHESRLYNKVNYDYLTGLPSMSYFFELAEAGRREFLRNGENGALLFIDLSGMKNFNQKYGFAEGNKLIRAVARNLVGFFGNESCSRFGGDHFVVYTRAMDVEKKTRLFLDSCQDVNDGKILPIRVGVYKDRGDDVDISTACDRARIACNKNRQTYINQINFFDDDMLVKEENRRYFIENLDKAIENNWIKIYYQPIVRSANGRVSDEEALARWVDKEKGTFEPSDFIPVLEDCRLVYKLDLYMTEMIIEKMKKQKEAGLYVVPQSVNLSRSDFESCDIVMEVKKLIDKANLDPSKLTIEITESTIGNNVDYMKLQIDRFRELGFKVWMDDYGSGYSSPDILQKISFDTIKLDMQFMRNFYENDKTKIIITEIVRMALGLGIETVAEGVETREQAEFLMEVGCTKLQGYYYCQPVPLETIINRYRLGIQIGFENPDESEYYEALGKINLYDLSFSGDKSDTLNNYFDTFPMVVVEISDEKMSLLRCNRSYREYAERNYFNITDQKEILFEKVGNKPGNTFINAARQCAIDGKNVIMDVITDDGTLVNVFAKRIAINPITKVAALVCVILGVTEDAGSKNSLTYAYIAEALSTDYIFLYYVDLDSGKYTEYSSSESFGNFGIERHGDDFFGDTKNNIPEQIYEDDIEYVRESFTKERIIKGLNERGHFTLTYRLIKNGKPIYVHMKIVRVRSRGNNIIIGVNNIDAQIKHQEAAERVKEERITYGRINALSGDFINIYAVNPETDSYVQYSKGNDIQGFGLSKTGDYFFDKMIRKCKKVVSVDDIDMFLGSFSKEQVLSKIEESGMYILNFRMIHKDSLIYVSLKAVRSSENNQDYLLFGLVNIDDQVKREQEYAHMLSVARTEANTDTLTGVKNKHAYVDIEARMDRMIEDGEVPEFAIVVLDLNGLKEINDTLGHAEGDNYLKRGCELICKVFKHSPVYRIGGDEFSVIAQGIDYENIDKLMKKLEKKNIENKKKKDVVVAGGMSRFNQNDSFSDVFERADHNMYENKKKLKSRTVV